MRLELGIEKSKNVLKIPELNDLHTKIKNHGKRNCELELSLQPEQDVMKDWVWGNNKAHK